MSILAKTPALAAELGDLLGALDEGETVYVDGVQDAALRSQLASFLSALRLRAPAKEVDGEKTPQGFRCGHGGGGVLRCVASLMDERGMVDPPPLDREAAFDTAKKVVDGLAAEEGMEGVREEVPVLLLQILDGELVMLEGLPNDKIRDALALLFEALGLESRKAGDDGETGYGIPDKGSDDSEAVIKQVIVAYGGEVVEQGSGAVAAVEEEGQAAGPAPRRAPIGPAMPSHAMLMQAQQAAAEYAQQGPSSSDDDDDDDEDTFGPSVAGKEKRVASEKADPNKAKRQKRHELKRAAEWENVTGVITGGQAALDKAEAESKGREEWMIVPPKSLGVLGALKTLNPTNRKFQTRSARGARAELHAPKAPKSKAEMEAEAAAEELMAKHREARGASLVERHKVEPGKAKKAAGGKEGGKKTFTWSREEDFEQRKKFTPQMYEELLQKSQELDTRFSRSISRNFL